jgi:hypothetical protein
MWKKTTICEDCKENKPKIRTLCNILQKIGLHHTQVGDIKDM